MSEPAVLTENLSKIYHRSRGDEVRAVDGLDLRIEKGELFGLLGPNGAGKTTTIGMLTTRVVPTGGTVSVAGANPRQHPVHVKRRLGLVTQRVTMDRQLTIQENLEFRGRYFGMCRRDARRRASMLLERFELTDVAKAYDDWVSGGQTRRAMICRAMMHRPEVLILDEPTANVDAQTRRRLWDTLAELNAEGQTILLTTHYMEEAESLCQRIGIIDHGKMVVCDSVDGLLVTTGAEHVLSVTFDHLTPGLADAVSELESVRRVGTEGDTLRVHTHKPDRLVGEIVALASDRGSTLLDVSTMRPSLETAFLNLTGREYRE